MAGNGPLLTLDTLARERPTIAIDGEAWPIALYDDFTLADIIAVERLNARLRALDPTGEELTDREAADTAAEIEAITLRVATIVLPGAPVERLNHWQRKAVIAAFTRAASGTPKTPPTPPRGTRGNRPTGARSAAASLRATAAD